MEKRNVDEAARTANRRDASQVQLRTSDMREACMLLAARWAEMHAPDENDTAGAALERFRSTHAYLDAVTNGVDPDHSARAERD